MDEIRPAGDGNMLRIVSDRDGIDWQKWEEFVESHPEGSFFQSREMFRFMSEAGGCEPFALAAVDERRAIHGVLQGALQREGRGWIGRFSSRAVVWGGPLILSGPSDGQAADRILGALVGLLKRRTIYIEFRNLFETAGLRNAFEKRGFAFHEHLNYVVRTGPSEDIERKLSSSRRRQIRKGLASGARISVAGDLGQVRSFYGILRELYDRKVRKPLPGWEFFEKFFRFREKLGPILLVSIGDDIIGGMVCPVFRDRAVYEWYVCGMDDRYPEHYPSVLATWAAIDYAHNNGFERFDFLGAGSPEHDYGVREFKSRFGGELVRHGRYRRINSRILYAAGKLGLKILGCIKGHAHTG